MSLRTVMAMRRACSRIRQACDLLDKRNYSQEEFKKWESVMLDAVEEAREAATYVQQVTSRQHDEANAAEVAWAKNRQCVKWANQHGIQLRTKKSVWRWIDSDELPGMIWGLPTIKGIPRITDGVLVYVERADGTVFKAHMDWFYRELVPKAESDKPKKARKSDAEFQEIFMD